MVNYYRKFLGTDVAAVAEPLTRLTRKGYLWYWGAGQQSAFEEFKKRLTSAPVLRFPDFSLQFVIQTDASEVGIGAVLSQVFKDGEHPVFYISKKLSEAEAKWPSGN